MEYRFEFAPRALRDAGVARAWILERSNSQAQANRWYRGLFQKIETLKDQPQRCPLAPEADAFGEDVRMLLYGKRRGVYKSSSPSAGTSSTSSASGTQPVARIEHHRSLPASSRH